MCLIISVGVPCPCENGGGCVFSNFSTLAEVECTCSSEFTGRLCQTGTLGHHMTLAYNAYFTDTLPALHNAFLLEAPPSLADVHT